MWRWVAGVVSAVVAIIITVKFFSTALPLLNLSITMDRSQAINKAQEFAHQYQLGPATYYQAASFSTDSHTKTFIELKAGGTEELIKVMTNHWYELYTWQVRHVQEFNHHEILFYFTPDGRLYGFFETLSEDEVGTNTDETAAQLIGQEFAQKLCSIDFSLYNIIQKSRKTAPSQRVDHTFTYERTDQKLGENGLYQLTITVSGNKCTGIVHSVKVPDDFDRTYQEIRSSNNTIAWGASFFTFLIYLLICIGFGLVLAFKKKDSNRKWCIAWGIGIGATQALVFLNQLPLLWMAYNSTISYSSFFLQMIVICLISLLTGIIQYSAIILGAYALTCAAFKNQIPLFNYWNSRWASSTCIAIQTVGCYWMVCFLILYVVLFYLCTTRLFGWWIPADALANPNILATYIPWFSAIAYSLKAGFIEECLFRAAPLSCAALLGNRLGKRKLCIAIAFIVQVLVFGAAHANYPGLPSYSRLIELIVPSCIFGGMYLMYGLFSAITTHTIYDIILFSLPIFVSSTSYINQASIIFITAIPLLIIIRSRYKTGEWFESVPEINLDEQSHIDDVNQKTKSIKNFFPHKESFSKKKIIFFSIAAFSTTLLCFLVWPRTHHAEKISISRLDAIDIARKELKSRSVEISSEWTPLVRLFDSYINDADQKISNLFVWQTTNKEIYESLLHEQYLMPPSWQVRFVRFSGTITQRSEEYCVYIKGDGQVFRVQHTVAQSTEVPSLLETEARELAYKELIDLHHLNKEEIEEISVESFKEPARIDWLFIFKNKSASELLSTGQARIYVIITGNTVSDSKRYIHVPEEWSRNYNGKELVNATQTILFLLCTLLILVFFWIRGIPYLPFKPLYIKSIVLFMIIALLLQYINLYNVIPALTGIFNTTEPYTHQLFRYMSSFILSKSVVIIICISLFIAATNPLPVQSLTVPLYFIGLGCGAILAATSVFTLILFPSYAPVWPAFAGLDFYSPLYVILFSALRIYFGYLAALFALFCLLHVYSDNSRIKTVLFSLLFFTFFMNALQTGGIDSTANITLLTIILRATIFGFVFALLYETILKYKLVLLLPTIVGYLLFSTLQQLYFNAIPNSFMIYTLVITILLIVSITIPYLLRRLNNYN